MGALRKFWRWFLDTFWTEDESPPGVGTSEDVKRAAPPAGRIGLHAWADTLARLILGLPEPDSGVELAGLRLYDPELYELVKYRLTDLLAAAGPPVPSPAPVLAGPRAASGLIAEAMKKAQAGDGLNTIYVVFDREGRGKLVERAYTGCDVVIAPVANFPLRVVPVGATAAVPPAEACCH